MCRIGRFRRAFVQLRHGHAFEARNWGRRPLLFQQFVEQSPHLGVWRSEIAILRAQCVRGQFAEGFAAVFREEKRDGIAGAIVRLANRSVQEDATVYGYRVHGTCGAVNRKIQGSLVKSEGTRACQARMLAGYFFATSNGYSSASAGRAEIKETMSPTAATFRTLATVSSRFVPFGHGHHNQPRIMRQQEAGAATHRRLVPPSSRPHAPSPSRTRSTRPPGAPGPSRSARRRVA
jgi:hypothetical protein